MPQNNAVDQDGDVEMTNAQPVFEYIKPPRLSDLGQPTLVKYMRDRRQYEERMWERCLATGEAHENVVVSIKSSMEPRLLEHLAHYEFRSTVEEVTETRLQEEIKRRAGSLMNDHVPDVAKLFDDNLKMDMKVQDIGARIAKYFMDFDRIVDEHGLSTWVGRGAVTDAAGRQRMKTRCKLLMTNLFPAVLRVDIERLVAVTHQQAKHDDVALYELIVRRAKSQQHYHSMQSELKRGEAPKSKPAGQNKSAGTRQQQPTDTGTRNDRSKVPKAVSVPPRSGCLICKGTHWAKDCPDATDAQKQEVKRELLAKKARQEERAKAVRSVRAGEGRRVCINGVLDVPFCPDTGADSNIISRALVEELRDVGGVVLQPVTPPIQVQVAGGARILCRALATLDLQIETAAGPLHLTSVSCLVMDGNEEEFLLGRKTMQDIGIDIDRLLEQLAGGDQVGDADEDDVSSETPQLAFKVDTEEIERHLNKMLDDAKVAGFDPALLDRLRTLVFEFADVWRINIGADPPADVEPLKVKLRADVHPYRSGTRKYPELQRKFLRDFVRELEQNGLVRRNNSSHWACPALPVKKPQSNEYRCTTDYRPINRCTVPLAGATPNLSTATQSVKGAYGFGLFDLFKGFWQLPLDPESQELFSFVTEDGVFTPTRVPQGASDSAMHFQLQMQECFRDMLYRNLLVWIDDLLLFAGSAEEYIGKLREFFVVLRARRLKLNAKKCVLFEKKVVWCGKEIDGTGIQHSQERLQALTHMQLPPTAAALQQFLCAANWLRDSMVDYARVVAPLQAKLELVMARRGRRKSQLTGVELNWPKEDTDAFTAVVELLTTSAKQYFADAEATVCMFSDASLTGWSVVLSQVHEWVDDLPVAEQAHELLVCRGGLFTGSQTNWSIIEKEAYPVVRACSDLAYLLEREKGVHIFCDHANLIHIFAPDKTIKPHLRGKLQRWALQMVAVRYTIEHIKGESNVWADLVSRWGQSRDNVSVSAVAVKRAASGDDEADRDDDREPGCSDQLVESSAGLFTRIDLSDAYMQVPQTPESTEDWTSVKRVTTRSMDTVSTLRPLQDVNFTWPTLEAVGTQQRLEQATAPCAADEDGLIRVEGKLWIPRQSRELLQRLLIVAHCGPQGHRGSDVMIAAIAERFSIINLKTLVARFLRDCLLCKHVKGGKIVMRPWGPTSTATKRNECVHLDYLYLGDSYGKCQYVLVLKDELTHYCELVAADSPASATAVEAVLDWHKRFGLPEMRVSDNGSHFKAAVMAELVQRLGATQKFVPVYTPWINGTVERVNRDILQVLRVLLLELNLDSRNWVYLLPVIQGNLNHSPVASLGGHAPVELFTGLPAPSLLDTVVVPVGDHSRFRTVDLSTVAPQLDALRAHMGGLHREVVRRKEQRRIYEIGRGNGKGCDFAEGDYVLWSRVDTRLRGTKLQVRWVGPFRVVRALSHSFMVSHLITGDEYEVHGSRLKHYCDAELGATAEIRAHVATQGIVLGVRAIVDHRYDLAAQEWQLLVAWRGLEDAENSWEPFTAMHHDVPTLVAQYVESVDVSDLAALL